MTRVVAPRSLEGAIVYFLYFGPLGDEKPVVKPIENVRFCILRR